MLVKLAGIALYLAVVAALGIAGWRRTSGASDDFTLAKRQAGPLLVGLSYGATFVSTSAIIGFGGVAAQFGTQLLWLYAMNLFVSVLLAISVFGVRARRLAESLGCQTFPELIARRFGSPGLGRFAAAVILVFTPIYGAAVLIGVARVLEVSLGVPFGVSILAVLVSTGIYVVAGGFRAVLYTDAFQALAMALLVPLILWFVLEQLGGAGAAYTALSGLAAQVPDALAVQGMRGYSQGLEPFSPLWLQVMTSTVFAVGVGSIALPQLVVRCMALGSDKELHRSAAVGAVFVTLVIAPAFLAGAFSNALFFQAEGVLAVAAAGGNVDRVIPLAIERFMPGWLSVPFLVAMLAAAMSTLSSLVHVGATTVARDLAVGNEVAVSNEVAVTSQGGVGRMRLGAAASSLAIALWAAFLPGGVIAQATAVFFGLVASAFLPVYLLALYSRAPDRRAAVAAIVVGSAVWLAWMALGFEPHALRLGLVSESIAAGTWAARVDPAVFAIPAAFAAAGVARRRQY